MRRTGLDYLKEKNKRDQEIEERRLDLEERKVAVLERNAALAEKRFEFEVENHKHVYQSQQEIINNLISVVRDLKK